MESITNASEVAPQNQLDQASFTTVFELIFNNTYNFTALLDSTGAFLEINRPALQVIGLSHHEIVGTPLWHLGVWPLASRPSVEAAVSRAIKGELVRYETEILGPQGLRIVIDFTIRPVPDAEGNTIFLVAEGRDMTAERETQARYQAVINALSEGVVQQERDGVISACNEAAERILGLTRDQMMGLSSVDPSWRAVHEDGSPYPGETHPSMVALTTGEVQQGKVMGIYKPNGTLNWIMINSQPLMRPGEDTPYAVVSSFTDITALKKAEAKLRHTALHDALTGLPSRSLLTDRLEQATLRAARNPNFHFALLFTDLDGFKGVNDALGHDAGDSLLIEVARQLKLCVREVDTVARLGGDEFVILLEGLTEPADATRLAKRILDKLTLSVPTAKAPLHITASVGIALPALGMTAHELLIQADKAMYQAKQAGKARYAVYNPSVETSQPNS